MRHIATIPVAFAAFLFLGSLARADMSICNDFRAPIHVAFAYPNDQDSFTAAGWWSADPNACETVDFDFNGNTLYYAADSDEYRDGRATRRDHWGNKVRLFVTSKKFNFDNADRRRRGTRNEMFSLIEISQSTPGKVPTITLHFHSGGTTINIHQ